MYKIPYLYPECLYSSDTLRSNLFGVGLGGKKPFYAFFPNDLLLNRSLSSIKKRKENGAHYPFLKDPIKAYFKWGSLPRSSIWQQGVERIKNSAQWK